MYSMVLMAALTTGVAAPDCHRCGGCGGCYGGGYGCWGCYGGCYGCFGGCGGCWGGWGCGGCYGGGYGCWGGYSSWGCMGCVGGYGGMSYPGAVMPGGAGVMGGGVAPGAGAEQLDKPKPNKNGDKETMAPTRAKLVVELPADAKLFIDDLPMKTTSGVRAFNTPTLEPGQAYYYMVRIEYVQDGKTVSETRRVIVRAGQVARADFKDRDTDAVRTVRAK